MEGNGPKKSSSTFQLAWGLLLAATGVGVFFRIPEVMPALAEKVNFAFGEGVLRFCLYVMGVTLIGGGVKKIIAHYRPVEDGGGSQDGED